MYFSLFPGSALKITDKALQKKPQQYMAAMSRTKGDWRRLGLRKYSI